MVSKPLLRNAVPLKNTQTGETGRLTIEGPESRFNYLIVVDGPGHELGYWAAYEWQRDGWEEVVDDEPPD